MAEKTDRWFLGTRLRIVADAEATGGAMTVMEQWAPPGFAPPLHVHHAEDTAIHLLEGSMRLLVGDREQLVGAGGFAWLPRDVPHSFVVGPDGAHLLELATPAGVETFHLDTSRPADGPGLPPPAEIDVPMLVAAFGRCDGEILGPPLS